MQDVQDMELHRIVPTALVHRSGPAGPEFLLIKRGSHKKVYPGRWTVPGGGVQTSDYTSQPKTTADGWYYPVEAALRRELAEEVGLTLGPLHYLLNMAFIRPDKVPVLVMIFYGECQNGEVKLDADSEEYTWITAAAAPDLDPLPGIAEQFMMVERILGGEPAEQVTFPGA